MLVNAPEIITKNLAFNNVNGNRKLRLSTNFLQVMGFPSGGRLSILESDKCLEGFKIVPDSNGSHKIHTRKYTRARGNKPLESLVEFSGQDFLDKAFPSYTERFHVTLRNKLIEFSPQSNRVHFIHNKLRKSDPLKAFVGLTGGVDIHCMESMGWKAEIVLEKRVNEARDLSVKRDLTEVFALNCLHNSSPLILLNEDIHHLEIDRLESLLSEGPPVSLAHYSLGCDEFSGAKNLKSKQAAIENLDTMYDMVYPMLKQIEVIKPAVVMVENVKQFASSGAGKIMTLTLRRLGYHITEMKLNSLDFGATQRRERYYMVASIYPNFEEPAIKERNVAPLKDLILQNLKDCNDVTDTKSIAARNTKNRSMPPFLNLDSLYCSTIMKSQDRGVSDAIYIEHQGRIYKPSENIIQSLMSIPDSFDISWMAKEQATETLGQSIDYKMHHAVMEQVTSHVKLNLGKRTIVKHTIKNPQAIKIFNSKPAASQRNNLQLDLI